MNILGKNYKIDLSSDVDQINGGGYGLFDRRNNVIKIANNLPMDEQVSTLLHEIIEALNYYLQLELPHNKIMSLESGLFDILSSNGVDLSILIEKETKIENDEIAQKYLT